MRRCIVQHGLCFAVAVAALLATALPSASQTALKVTLDGRIEGPSAPLFVALERGDFKAANLDVSIEPSAGGAEPFTRVASGAFDIGIADINAMIRFRDQNPTSGIKAVFIVNNRPTYALVGRKSRGVTVPSDLDDKRLGLPVAENATAAWPIFARLNGIDPAKVRAMTIGLPVREPMLIAGEVDVVTGTSFVTPINLRDKGVPADDITTMLMAQYGVELYGSAIFVSAKALAEKPDAVRAFLAAFVSGLKETMRDPAAAIPTVIRRMNGSPREHELERLQIVIRESIDTPQARTHGLGAIDPARFDTAIDQIGMAYSFKAKPKTADVFDSSFLPSEAERRAEAAP